ncbi:MAG: hypothetical protein H6913_00085 [Altererythrobacter sp.]|nr:hypothetical protein [Altererythrobacter sp.]
MAPTEALRSARESICENLIFVSPYVLARDEASGRLQSMHDAVSNYLPAQIALVHLIAVGTNSNTV